MDVIDIDDMIPREELKNKKRRVRSTSDLREKTKSTTSLNSTTGVKKRSIWDIISPRNIRKKYGSNIGLSTESLPALNRDENLRGVPLDTNEDQMVMPGQVNIQTSNRVRVVPVSDIIKQKDNTSGIIKTADAIKKQQRASLLGDEYEQTTPLVLEEVPNQPKPLYDHRLSLAMLKKERSEQAGKSMEVRFLDNDFVSRDSHV